MAQSHLSEAERVLEIVPETAQEFAGFASNPSPLLVAQYERIAREEMQALPFYHATMPIVAECVLFEGQWLGCVLTPLDVERGGAAGAGSALAGTQQQRSARPAAPLWQHDLYGG